MEETGKCYPNYDRNVWLRSCKKEIIEPTSGVITGTIPSWLNGVLIRNGPGTPKVGNCSFKHVFDGPALLHRFAIKDGQVTYQSRFLQTESYKRNKKANRIVITEFGTKAMRDPCHTIFQRIAATFSSMQKQPDNANVSVYPFGDELYTFTDFRTIYRVNQNTLETEKKVDVSKNVVIVNHSAHPHVVEDGTVYNLALTTTKFGPTHYIVCFPAKPKNSTKEYSMFEKAHIVARLPARWKLYPSYMHTFGITDNYFIIVEQPLNLSVPSVLIGRLTDEPIFNCFKWHGKKMTRINVISRKTGKLAYKFYSEAFCFFHIINQYEASGHIILDICSYKDASVLQCMYTETIQNMHMNPHYADMFRSQSIRFVLPLITSKNKTDRVKNLVNIPNTDAEAHFLPDGKIFLKPESLCNLSCEMPRIHYERYLGKEYQFYYAISSDVDSENPGTIIKVDICNKTTLTWYETNCYPSEPIFIAKPDPQSEDDGVVVSAMLWGNSEANRTGLLVLDAKTFQELGRAEFQTHGPVPKCIHGWFLPE